MKQAKGKRRRVKGKKQDSRHSGTLFITFDIVSKLEIRNLVPLALSPLPLAQDHL